MVEAVFWHATSGDGLVWVLVFNGSYSLCCLAWAGPNLSRVLNNQVRFSLLKNLVSKISITFTNKLLDLFVNTVHREIKLVNKHSIRRYVIFLCGNTLIVLYQKYWMIHWRGYYENKYYLYLPAKKKGSFKMVFLFLSIL